MLGGRSAPPSPPKIPRVNLGSQKPCEVRSSEYRRSFTTLRSISPPRRVSGIKYWHSTHRTNLQHRLVLELSEGLPFDRRQAQWRIDLFWRQLQALSARPCRSLARNLCTHRGIRREFSLKVESLAKVSKHAYRRPRVANAAFDGRFMA